MAGGRVNVCGMAIPGGAITGATVATVGGAIIVAGAIVGLTTPGKAISTIGLLLETWSHDTDDIDDSDAPLFNITYY